MKKIFLLVAIVVATVAVCGGQQMSQALKQMNDRADAASLVPTTQRRPLIGLTASAGTGTSVVGQNYYNAVKRAGGMPVIIPVDTTTEYLAEVIKELDGLVLIGGVDVDPSFFGESAHKKLGTVDTLRDVNELKLIRLAYNRNVPMLGVCRGCQMLNVALGGSLIQDIPSQVKDQSITHRVTAGASRVHDVKVEPGSLLHKIVGKESLGVNSAHHQAVKALAPGAHCDAASSDGVVEAIDFYPLHRILGVQWHPEGFRGEDADMNKIFDFFLGEACLFRHARELHARILSVDSHTDAPLSFVRDGKDLITRSNTCVNLPKMQEGYIDSQFFAAWVWSDTSVVKDGKKTYVPRPLNDATFDGAWARTLQLIDATNSEIAKNSTLVGLARSDKEAAALKAQGKKAVFLGVENGLGVGHDLSRIEELARRGVKYITLTHTRDNQLCNSSTYTVDGNKGLTPFGRKVVKEMNRLGIMVDLSHCSEGTFWEVLKLSSKPVVCSHSGARALCDHDRNLTDDQLRALAKHGGVVQTVSYEGFLLKEGKATIEDFMDHIDYMVKVAGIDHVGIGTDFDGGGGVPGLEGDNDMINITMRLIERGYSDEDIAKIWGGNFFRVMNAQ
ncbi:MAG: membrane dipeptidase [Muribaculaceae bacterium]|nr:membrane dipeptidase [Muribaculaceae bacterium]